VEDTDEVRGKNVAPATMSTCNDVEDSHPYGPWLVG
jgi:hypothetical protein